MTIKWVHSRCYWYDAQGQNVLPYNSLSTPTSISKKLTKCCSKLKYTLYWCQNSRSLRLRPTWNTIYLYYPFYTNVYWIDSILHLNCVQKRCDFFGVFMTFCLNLEVWNGYEAQWKKANVASNVAIAHDISIKINTYNHTYRINWRCLMCSIIRKY